ncbi:hypothetical protein LD771_03730 [Salmonella enterica]|nr:hypothetical protein [Salmonella enterica]
MNLRSGMFVAGFSFFYAGATLSENHQQTYSVELGASRIIYPLNGKNSAVRAVNNQDYPVLVKSQVLLASDKKHGLPLLSPRLFSVSTIISPVW